MSETDLQRMGELIAEGIDTLDEAAREIEALRADAARLREALEKVEAEATRVHDLAKTQAVVAAAEGNYQSAAATAAEAGGYAYLALYIKRIRERAALTAPADPTGGQ